MFDLEADFNVHPFSIKRNVSTYDSFTDILFVHSATVEVDCVNNNMLKIKKHMKLTSIMKLKHLHLSIVESEAFLSNNHKEI